MTVGQNNDMQIETLIAKQDYLDRDLIADGQQLVTSSRPSLQL